MVFRWCRLWWAALRGPTAKAGDGLKSSLRRGKEAPTGFVPLSTAWDAAAKWAFKPFTPLTGYGVRGASRPLNPASSSSSSSSPTLLSDCGPPSTITSTAQSASHLLVKPMDRRPGTFKDSQVIVRTLACVLEKLVDVNQKLDVPSPQAITKFHASRPPNISITDYLERVNKYASCSTESLVLALIYIDRLIQQSNLALSALNVHRIIITSVMLAAKFFDDRYFNNMYYAKVGGVPNKEINSLEVEFLFLINFSLHVTEDMYFRYYNELVNHAVNSTCACCTSARISRPVSPAIPRASYVPTMVCPPTPPTIQPTTQSSIAVCHTVPADVERFTYYSIPSYESAATEQSHGAVAAEGRTSQVLPYTTPMGNPSWDRAPGGALLHHYGPKSCVMLQSKSLPQTTVVATSRNMPFTPVQDHNTRAAPMAFYAHHHFTQVLHT